MSEPAFCLQCSHPYGSFPLKQNSHKLMSPNHAGSLACVLYAGPQMLDVAPDDACVFCSF